MKNSVDRHLLAVLSFLSVLVAGQPAWADEVDSRSDYIVNGSPTEAGELRGTLALLFAPEADGPDDLARRTLWTHFRCSAVLIAPSVAVTAAHCVDVCEYLPCGLGEDDTSRCYVCGLEPLPTGSLYIAAGLRTLDDVWTAEVRAVREQVVHPVHDIALLLLETPVASANPMPILPDDGGLVGKAGIAEGYGLRVSPEYEDLLDQRQYEFLLNGAITPIEQVTDDWIATAQGPNQSGVCYGDSGGPLYVDRGDELFVAGIASALWQVEGGPECGAGGLYVSAPGRSDWIYENAPEAIDGAGGGCSAASTRRAPNGIWLAAMLVSLLLVRTRRIALVVTAVALLGAPSTGCGSDGENDRSYCSDEYDPTGESCDPGVARIVLEEAVQRARSAMPSEALLWSAVGGTEGTVNPDGEAEAWFLRYFIPGEIELPDALFRSVTVHASGDLRPYQELGTVQCVPTEAMIPFDSRDLVHDAIRRFEQAGVSVRVGEEGLLRVYQSHRCARRPDEWGGVGFADSFLYYSDDGSYLGMEGAP